MQPLKFLKRMFGNASMPAAEEGLVPLFMPPLVVLLMAKESAKGAPLSEAEVIAIRDKAPCILMRKSHAAEMHEKRGGDICPETVWRDWQAYRSEAASQVET